MSKPSRSLPTLLFTTALLTSLGSALAATPPPPYSLPWGLRPAQPPNILRLDTSVARFTATPGAAASSTVASMLLASAKVTDTLAPMVRLGLVRHGPAGADTGTALVNPLLGLTYGRPLGFDLRGAVFVAATVPVGMGGGNSPSAATAAAARAGVLTRSAMDNAVFAVNDLTVVAGIDVAYVRSGLTLQLEGTVLQLTRVRGEAVQPDRSRTNSTFGLHAGYFFTPWASLGAELRYQRWLSTPTNVSTTPALRDNVSVAAGPRFHVPLAEGLTLRPGLSYTTGLDDPMRAQRFHIVGIDVPLAF